MSNAIEERLLQKIAELEARIRHLETLEYVGELSKYMLTATYDADGDDIVDNSEALEGLSLAQVRNHTPVDHHTRHESGGADEISVAGLSGVLADKQDADKLQGRALASTAPTDGQIITWDDSGSTWKPDVGIYNVPMVFAQDVTDWNVNQEAPNWMDDPNLDVNITLPTKCDILAIVYLAWKSDTQRDYSLNVRLMLDDTTHSPNTEWMGEPNANCQLGFTFAYVFEAVAAGNRKIEIQAIRNNAADTVTILKRQVTLIAIPRR